MHFLFGFVLGLPVGIVGMMFLQNYLKARTDKLLAGTGLAQEAKKP